MGIASDYEKASRSEQKAHDDAVAIRDMHKRAVALAIAVYSDEGDDVRRAEFDEAGAMYGTDLDHAWEIYLALAYRTR